MEMKNTDLHDIDECCVTLNTLIIYLKLKMFHNFVDLLFLTYFLRHLLNECLT